MGLSPIKVAAGD